MSYANKQKIRQVNFIFILLNVQNNPHGKKSILVSTVDDRLWWYLHCKDYFFLYFRDMNFLGLKFSCKSSHFSAYKIIKVTINSKG